MLTGLTGGLAAPLIAAGAGVFIGASGAATLGSVAGVAIIGSLFGVAGAGLTGSTSFSRFIKNFSYKTYVFSALTLLVGHQEEHPACRNWVMVSGARCRLFAYMFQPMPLHPKTPSSQVLPFWYRLTQVVLEKWRLNGCNSSK